MKIILNADDFGMSHEVNMAIHDLMCRGEITNTSIVVNCEYSDEAVRLAKEGNYMDKVTLHINLTTGHAISEGIKKIKLYCLPNGDFVYKPIIKKYNQIAPIHIKVVREEIEAQISKFIQYGFNLKAIDSHNWVHLRLPVWIALKPLLKKYNIFL